MNAKEINDVLLRGDVDREGLFPHLDALRRRPFVFSFDFGLPALPTAPGLLVIRGARQYGKSTWLEGALRQTVQEFGPATAVYLNGDELRDAEQLTQSVRELATSFRADAPVRRLFIDEITAVPDWTRGLKRVLDRGELKDVLVVTTGSKATDLHRGVERLPGRRGRLDRTTWHFTPVSFREFTRVCGDALGADVLWAYLIAGGSPLACGELAATGRLPEWVPETTRDWILGECIATGRNRSSLLGVISVLLAHGGSPVSQTRIARDAPLANNTVAVGYLDLLTDLMCVGTQRSWDASRRIENGRTPTKSPFVNLLAATSWHPSRIRSVSDFRALPESEQGIWIEWLVAQELTRRRAIAGEDMPHEIPYWQSRDHEIDFVTGPRQFLEVKRGRASPLDFAWFPAVHPKSRLRVICASEFQTDTVESVSLESFMSEA